MFEEWIRFCLEEGPKHEWTGLSTKDINHFLFVVENAECNGSWWLN